MSHTTNPFVPPKPAEITLDTLPQLFAHNRARFGGWSMTQTPPEPGPQNQPGSQQPPANQPPADQPPERPSDIGEDEWNALGDPGKRAIVRERSRAEAAERALAASRARPAPPKPSGQQNGGQGGQQSGSGQGQAGSGQQQSQQSGQHQNGAGDQPDVAAIVQQAVQAAIKPFVEREEQRDAQTAAKQVQDDVVEAAKSRLHDATDALTNIDLTTVVNDQGQTDADKVKTALDNLVQRKPHLAKPTTERTAPPGIGGGAPAGATDAEKVKSVLADMQRATGVRPPASSTTN